MNSQAQAFATLQVLVQATAALSQAWGSLLGGQTQPGAFAPGPWATTGVGAQANASFGFAYDQGFQGHGVQSQGFLGQSLFGQGGFGSGQGALAYSQGGGLAGAWAAAGQGLAQAGAFSGPGGVSATTPLLGTAQPGLYGNMQNAYAGGWGSEAQTALLSSLNAAAALHLDFGYRPYPGQSQKMWDVWFDSKQGQNTVQRSPLVLDLNKNGKADITGKNITGDGKIDGPTTLFDLDPNNVSYEFKSQQRRPGSGAPAVDGGYWVDPQGNRVKDGPPKGTQAKFNGFRYMDKDGNLVGEMKDGLYNYGKQEKREATEWLAKDGGDGFLVADLNGDGEINSAVELFGTEGTNGAKYRNGYDKLAALFDKNRDGQVNGAELQGLQVWADKNADGKVQQGELQSLQQHEITSLNVGNYDRNTMEGNFEVGGGQVPYFNLSAALALAMGGLGQPFFNPPPFSPSNPYGSYPWAGSY